MLEPVEFVLFLCGRLALIRAISVDKIPQWRKLCLVNDEQYVTDWRFISADLGEISHVLPDPQKLKR